MFGLILSLIRVKKFKYLGSLMEEKRDIRKILIIILGRDDKNGGILLEYYVIRKFM